MLKIPAPSKFRGSMVPLRGLQLLCCAAVVGVGIHVSSTLTHRADATHAAVGAFEAALHSESAIAAALHAASAGLSEIQVVVERNDTLDGIFRRLELSLSDLANIRAIDSARQALDRLRPGDLLTLFTRDEQLVGLERALSDTSTHARTLKIERDDSDAFIASVHETPFNRVPVSSGGVIESSLWAAGLAAGLDNGTVAALTDIFGWDVNFSLDLRSGDSFRLIYEKLERDGEIIRDGDILAAEFVNAGKSYHAVRYTGADGKTDYYTPEGISVRKAFLASPVEFSRISSVFNPRRRHPVLNTIRAHRGVDYAAPTGTPVRAVGDGRVRSRGVNGGYGNMVEIAHANGVVTRYAHLSRFAQGLTVGQRVKQGQTIGAVGMTGLATGPHLHFEYIERGTYIDPQKAIRRGEPGPPIPASERAAFDQTTAPLLAGLAAAPTPVGTALAAR